MGSYGVGEEEEEGDDEYFQGVRTQPLKHTRAEQRHDYPTDHDHGVGVDSVVNVWEAHDSHRPDDRASGTDAQQNVSDYFNQVSIPLPSRYFAIASVPKKARKA